MKCNLLISTLQYAAMFALLILFPCSVAAEELVFGMSAPFSGHSQRLGIEYYRGFSAYINYFNEKGGADGVAISIRAYDDAYDPQPCVDNTIRLLEEDKVFALLGYVGTPTTTRMLPLLEMFKDKSVYLLFPLSGAAPLREEPYGKFIYGLRASYFDEVKELVDYFLVRKYKRIAVFYQADAYGRSGWDGIRTVLADNGLKMVGEAAYSRGATFDRDFSEEVDLIMQSDPDVVMTIATAPACAAFVRDARNSGLTVPISMVSFSDSDEIINLLKAQEKEMGLDYTSNLISSQVVPTYGDASLPGIRLYRNVMDKYAQSPCEMLMDKNYQPRRYGFISLEGFMDAMILAEMVKRMEGDFRRERIPEVMESIVGLDIGFGQKINYGQGRGYGLDKVYLMTFRKGKIIPVRGAENIQ